MDFEHGFICRLLKDRDMQPVIEARVNPDYFADGDHRKVFEYISKHHAKYGEVPLPEMVKANWPTYRLVRVDHAIAWYIEELRKQYMHDNLLSYVASIQEALEDKDPQEALRYMQEAVSEISAVATVLVDEDLTQTWQDRIDLYDELSNNQGRLRGMPTGFVTIDRATNGIQKKQFIVLAGLPKAGKSTLLLAISKAVHDYARKVLFIGFEMTNQEQGARYDAMVAKVDHMKMLNGTLSDAEFERIEKAGKRREEMDEFVVSADISSTTTVQGIAAKIDQYKPDAVFVDGIYLMDDENGEPKGSSQALTNITRGIKRLAQVKDVPIVGTTQVLHSKVSKSLGVQPSSIGYTSSFAQDCDVLIAVEGTEEDDIQLLKVLLSRSGPRVETEVLWDWSTGTFEELEGNASDD